MKIIRGELKPNILHLIDISLIVLRNGDLAQIQSVVECPEIYHLCPQKIRKNLFFKNGIKKGLGPR